MAERLGNYAGEVEYGASDGGAGPQNGMLISVGIQRLQQVHYCFGMEASGCEHEGRNLLLQIPEHGTLGASMQAGQRRGYAPE